MTEHEAARHPPWSARLASLAIFLAAATSFGLGLGWLGLIEPDEARYAAVARAMLDQRDFVTPRFNGFVYLDKPPALHWLTALSFAVLGSSEFAARLFPMLAAAATVAFVYAFGRQAFGHGAGLCAALVLASCIMWFAIGHVLRYDMLLALAIAATLWWAWRGSQGGPGGRRSYAAASVAAALGVLVKGPVAAALPAIIIVAYLAITGRLRALLGVPWLLCVSVFALTAIPWFALCERANPGAASFFLLHENLARAAGKTDATHWEPWWYFLAIVAIGSAPWTLLVPGAVVDACRRQTEDETQRRASLLLVVWLVVVVALFSIPKVKLPPYVLPAMPALALLLGRYLAHLRKRPYTLVLTAACLIAGAVALQALGPEPAARAGVTPMPIVPLTAAAVLAGGVGALAYIARKKPVAAAASIATAVLVLYCGVLWGATRLAKPPSDRAAAMALARHREPGEKVVCYGELSRGAVFYLDTRVILMGNPPGEYDFPANQQQVGEWVHPVEETARLFAQSPSMMGLSRLRNWDNLLQHAPGRVEELERVGKHVIFRTIPAPGPGRKSRSNAGIRAP